MNFPELHQRDHDFAGTTGLIYLGDQTVLSYIRDGDTTSYPYHVDLIGGGREAGETPFETWRRECQEETGLDTRPEQIIYAKEYTSLVNPSLIGYFVVAKLDSDARSDIRFGGEGLSYQLTSVEKLLAEPLIIPRRKLQIEAFLSETALSNLAA